MKKCCMFTRDADYMKIVYEIHLYIGEYEYETVVRPFQLGYRRLDLYVIDSTGARGDELFKLMNRLPKMAISHPGSVFLLWNRETRDHFNDFADPAKVYNNVLCVDSPDWIERTLATIRKFQREEADEKQ